MKIYILSGAGLSAPSNIPTYREKNGIWSRYNILEYATHEAWEKDPKKVISFFDQRRVELKKYKPNRAHYFIASLKNKIHLTQNIDDLSTRANDPVIYLHGKLREVRCDKCLKSWDIGYNPQPQRCIFCNSPKVRPNVVLFGEIAQNYKYLYTIKADIFIAIGTSGRVIDIADIAQNYPISILINPKREKRFTTFYGEFDEYIDQYFTYYIQKDIIDALKDLKELLNQLNRK